MKRSRASSPSSDRRTSTRVIQRRGPAMQEQSISFINADDLYLRSARQQCWEFNDHLPFVKDDMNSNSLVQRQGAAIAKTVGDINNYIKDVRDQMREQVRTLERQTTEFTASTFQIPKIYERGDLLSLSILQLKNALRAAPILDKHHFTNYLLRIIPEALRKKPPVPSDNNNPDLIGEEENEEEETRETREERWRSKFVDKVFVLVSTLLCEGWKREAFQVLVLLKSLLCERRDNVRFNEPKDLRSAHENIDTAIRCLLDEREIPDEAFRRCENSEDPTDHSRHTCHIDTGSLSWQSNSGPCDVGFWDVASASRILREAYFDHDCERPSPPDQDDTYPLQYTHRTRRFYGCFHRDSIHLLAWLQKKAWSETRAKIFLTVGTILPVELVEEIFEYALLAEGIPAEPDSEEPIIIDGLVKFYDHGGKVMRMKDSYRCRHTREWDDYPGRRV